jgi:hypothetical protein
MERLDGAAGKIHTDAHAWGLLNDAFKPPPVNSPLEGEELDPSRGPGLKKLWSSPRKKARILMKLFKQKHAPEPFCSPLEPRVSDTIRRGADGKRRLEVETISKWEMRSAFNRLKPNGSADESGVSPRLLLMLKEILIPALAGSLTQLLRTHEPLPDSWHRCTFVALLKSNKTDRPEQANSYRPIAITSLLCRLCERVIAQRLMARIRDRLHPTQFGYQQGKSTIDALATILDDALNGFSDKKGDFGARAVDDKGKDRARPRKGEAILGLVDLSDAFSKAPHDRIIAAMDKMDAPQYITAFVERWLKDRKGRVFCQGERSPWEPLRCGVPQGSVLGPILFIIFINSLLVQLDAKRQSLMVGREGKLLLTCIAYVDDITLSVTGKFEKQMAELMRMWCKELTGWARENGMLISDKTEFLYLKDAKSRRVITDFADPQMRMEIGGITKRITTEPKKLLGLTLDSGLTFKDHAEKVVQAADLRATQLRTVSRVIHPRHCKSLWSSATSTMLYGSEIWQGRLGQTKWKQLNVVMEKGLRAVAGLFPSSRGEDAYYITGMLPLQVIARRRAVMNACRVSALPWGTRHPLLRGRYEGSELHQGVIPITFPMLPPRTDVDKVKIFPGPKNKVVRVGDPEEKRKHCNTEQRKRLLEHVPLDSFLFEGWSDGSVEQSGNSVRCGGGTVIYRPGTDPRTTMMEAPIVGHHPSPQLSCSYAAEVTAGLALITQLTLEVRSWKENHPGQKVSVLIFSDGQSWLSHMAIGPTGYGAFLPRLWNEIEQLAAETEAVVLGFMFAHCNDQRGDMVDMAAAEAREASLEQSSPWHKDTARDLMQTLDLNRPRVTPGLLIRSVLEQGLAMQLPPPSLKTPIAREICRIRSGVWWRLGLGAILANAHGTPCKKCNQPLTRGNGAPVLHVLGCGQDNRITLEQLWSQDPLVLHQVYTRCMQFDVTGFTASS